jgi:hypothetical protein
MLLSSSTWKISVRVTKALGAKVKTSDFGQVSQATMRSVDCFLGTIVSFSRVLQVLQRDNGFIRDTYWLDPSFSATTTHESEICLVLEGPNRDRNL